MTARPEGDSTAPLLPYGFAREAGILVRGRDRLADIVATIDAAPHAFIEVRRVLGMPLKIETATRPAFERLLSEQYAMRPVDAADIGDEREGDDLSRLADGLAATEDLLAADDDAPVIRLINGLIAEAARRDASDLHIEPREKGYHVRMRVDGMLMDRLALPAHIGPALLSRIKVMARLDITERRLPQDGRISLAIGGKALDIRVSTLPARHGERAVLRLLDHEREHLTIPALGMKPATEAAFLDALESPSGIILVSGPTGSGKTTTLYAGLGQLNDRSRNILTIEDPVEYALEGIGQTQVNAKVGMSFAAGLRAILRQDPDIVMVGEIRDAETARIAIQASLTGHLVLSTIHTNSAVAAVTRLRDMGMEPFLLSSSLKAVLAQRLLRRLCRSCCLAETPDAATEALFADYGVAVAQLNRPGDGCPDCKGSGHAGRIAVHEILRIDARARRLIHDAADEADLAAHAMPKSESLFAHGLVRAAAGEVALAEVMRVCRQEESDGGL